MRLFLIFAYSLCMVYASLNEDREQWNTFKSKYGKYYKNLQEDKLRFSIFQQNLRTIEEHNKEYEIGKTTYTKGVNQFTDLTKEEFVSTLKLLKVGRSNLDGNVIEKPVSGEVPTSIDWREKGAVTEVENQGICGESWAFSVIGTLEGFNFVKSNKLVALSIQQLADCATESGCTGGDVETALEYIKEYGIETEESYPNSDTEQTCHYNASEVFLRVKDFIKIEPKDENGLLSAVGLLGPVSVSLDATQLTLYQGGVFDSTDCSPDTINHAVLAVGYGKDEQSGLDYWLVKNSWGKFWGEDGYFKIKRGVNECGIAMASVYPVL